MNTCIAPATIRIEAGHTWWLCPSCGKRLAEIVGDRVVIRQGRSQWSMPVRNQPETVCPHCLASSVLDQEAEAP
jgi:hypothetical protein